MVAYTASRVTWQEDDNFDNKRRFALLIGVEYENRRLRLPVIDRDVLAFRDLLSSQWPAEHVHSLLHEHTTKSEILKTIGNLFSILEPEDVFLLYFSGHGGIDGKDGISYLLPRDFDPNDLASSSINISDILALLPNRETYHSEDDGAIIFITDACNPSSLFDSASRFNSGFEFPLSLPLNFVGFTSSRRDEASYVVNDKMKGEYSLFTYHLLEGLRGHADRENRGAITVFDLYSYVSRKVQDDAQTLLRQRQTPVLSYHGTKNFVIVTYPKSEKDLNDQKQKDQAEEISRQLGAFAKHEAWQKVLDQWDQLLNVAGSNISPNFDWCFTEVLRAREEIDKKYDAFDDEDIGDSEKHPPRIWPCYQETTFIYSKAYVAHPYTHKGDIVLEFDVLGDSVRIVRAHVVKTNALPAYSRQEKRIRSYVLLSDRYNMDLSASPVLRLDTLQQEVRHPLMKEAVQSWLHFEMWIHDLKGIDNNLWDQLRYAILKDHTYQAELFLDAELSPLIAAIQKYSAAALSKNAKHLFYEYQKIVTLPYSRFDLEKLQKAQNLWSNTLKADPPVDAASQEQTDVPLLSPVEDSKVYQEIVSPTQQPPSFAAQRETLATVPEQEQTQPTPVIASLPPPTEQRDVPATLPPQERVEPMSASMSPSLSPSTSKSESSVLDKDALPASLAESKLPAVSSVSETKQEGVKDSSRSSAVIDSRESVQNQQYLGTPGFSLEPPALSAADQLTTMVWQNVMQTIGRQPSEPEIQGLDIHIMPSFSHQVAEAKGEKLANGKYPYQVVLRFFRLVENKFTEDWYEGRLRLDPTLPPPHGEDSGADLYHALFHTSMPDIQDRLRAGASGLPTLLGGFKRALALAENSEGLRLRLRINNDAPDLHNYRWEYLCDPEGKMPLACNEHTPFARVLHIGSGDNGCPRISPLSPLRILTVMSNPSDLDKLLLEKIEQVDFDAVKAVIEHIASKSHGTISPLTSENVLESSRDCVSLDELHLHLLDAHQENKPFHVLHILCHGVVKDDKAYLILHKNNSDEAETVEETFFVRALVEFIPDLRLVVLASCSTALATDRNPLSGIARALVDRGVPAVIAMQDEFESVAAKYFSWRLYAELARHGRIDQAVNAARGELYRRSLQGPEDNEEARISPEQWGVPVLFTNLPDGKLFEMDKQSESDAETLTLPPIQVSAKPDKTVLPSAPPSLSPTIISDSMFSSNEGTLPQEYTWRVDAVRTPAIATAMPILSRFSRWKSQEPVLYSALVQTVREYRLHQARRSVLFLRSLARARITELLHPNQLSSLKAVDFQQHIWKGGHVVWNAKEVIDVLEGGPVSDSLVVDDQPIGIQQWRESYRGLTLNDLRITGNLVWSGGGRTALSDGQQPAWSDLERLLYGQENTFAVFKELTEDEERCALGLDEHTTSLMLHAVDPTSYVPYHADLARNIYKVLKLRQLPDYADYCTLVLELMIDENLGFEHLADVSYFLQRLTEHKISLQKHATPTIAGQVKLQIVNLKPTAVDSELVLDHNVLKQATNTLNAGKHIIFIGPPGTGKTTLAEDLCRYAHDQNSNRGYILVTATADWTPFDTLGGYMPDKQGQLVFHPGIFLKAIREQKWLIIDEINRADIDKAFGELFTVLSGQPVTLPYTGVSGQPIRVLPPDRARSDDPYDYVIHPSWRIIGSVNIYDKASLFTMSHAFMRRFAFVDVPIPPNDLYQQLIKHFWLSAGLTLDTPDNNNILKCIQGLFDQKNHLMHCRSIGPAMIKDVIYHLRQCTTDGQQVQEAYVIEALLLYIVPQLEGLGRESILKIYHMFEHHFSSPTVCRLLLKRIEEIFPFIEWEKYHG